MKIAVYLGSTLGNDSSFEVLTRDLGAWMLKHDHDLVYGGGSVGLMDILANTILEGKRNVYGIIVSFLKDLELAKTDITHLEEVDTMQLRKLRMTEEADAFIALPGGPGTLEEIVEVISLARVHQHDKPCILLNHRGYYEPLKAQYQMMIEHGFYTEAELRSIHFIDNLDDLSIIISKAD